MIGNITSTVCTFGVGYYIGKNYSGYVGDLITLARSTEEPPISINDKNVKIFGVTIVSYK